MSAITDVGQRFNTQPGIRPVSSSGGQILGPSIDRARAHSCELFQMTGAVSGTPTTISVISKLQSSPDGSTGWADISGSATFAVGAANSQTRKNVSLQDVSDQFIRAVIDVVFTGGTTPSVMVASSVAVGGVRRMPIG